MPATELPLVRGRDYYANANDSPWLSNPESPLLGYPQVLGEGATPRSLRTRLALDQIRARLAGSDGRPGRVFDRKSLAATFFDNRSLGGELLLEDLLAVCATLSQAPAEVLCAALAAWDRRNDLDSRGSHAFKEVLQALGPLEGLWRVRFDPSSPLDTPRGLAVEQPQVAAAVARALVTAAGRLTAAGVDPGAPLGDVQYRKVGSQRIPIHGGSHRTGAFNVVEAALTPAGYTPIAGGSSFILVVGFEGDGPRAEAGLSHSLSSDPSSPHYSDLTRLYSEKRLLSLPFREAEIRADPGLRSKRLRE
jgi:acyl-homoserine-lactone acylase